MALTLVAFLLGAVTWTLLEYLLHRYAFHGAVPKWPGASEHRRHHARVDYFAPWWQKAIAAVAVTALLWSLLSQVAGMRPGFFFTLGFVLMYLLYEVLHRRAHTHPPRGSYGRWLRKNHFAHHFINPRMAQGVTTPVWDVVFGTRLTFDRVPVPRRKAMPWMLDEKGELAAAYTRDYEIVGVDQAPAATSV